MLALYIYFFQNLNDVNIISSSISITESTVTDWKTLIDLATIQYYNIYLYPLGVNSDFWLKTELTVSLFLW